MEVARLYESPCTDTAPQGPDMIFTGAQVDGIVAILGKLRDHALPNVTVA
jgi:type I restriction enzyme, R subunit